MNNLGRTHVRVLEKIGASYTGDDGCVGGLERVMTSSRGALGDPFGHVRVERSTWRRPAAAREPRLVATPRRVRLAGTPRATSSVDVETATHSRPSCDRCCAARCSRSDCRALGQDARLVVDRDGRTDRGHDRFEDGQIDDLTPSPRASRSYRAMAAAPARCTRRSSRPDPSEATWADRPARP